MIRKKYANKSWTKKRTHITKYGFQNAKESKMDKKPSEIIQEFLQLLDESHEHFNEACSLIEAENNKTLVNTHLLEDCEDDELYEFAYKWRDALRERRKQCDRKALYENIHRFAISEANKPTAKRLNGLVKEQIKTEEYLDIPYKEREFKGGTK